MAVLMAKGIAGEWLMWVLLIYVFALARDIDCLTALMSMSGLQPGSMLS